MRPYIYKTESKHIYRLIIAGTTRITIYRERRHPEKNPGVFGSWQAWRIGLGNRG